MLGKIISHYQAVEEPSRGCIGVVYCAKEPDLNRPVAFSRDRERLARFDRETELLTPGRGE